MDSMRFEKILLLVGSSNEAQKAAGLAIDIAAHSGARLIAISVVDRMSINRMKRFAHQSATEIEIEMEENGWKYLYAVEEQSKGRGVPTAILQRSGVVDAEVLGEAGRLGVDLIVLAYPPRTAGQVRRLVQGSVEKTVEGAAVPVLVVK